MLSMVTNGSRGPNISSFMMSSSPVTFVIRVGEMYSSRSSVSPPKVTFSLAELRRAKTRLGDMNICPWHAFVCVCVYVCCVCMCVVCVCVCVCVVCVVCVCMCVVCVCVCVCVVCVRVCVCVVVSVL